VSVSTDPGPGAQWRAIRIPVVALAVLVLVSLALAVVTSRNRGGLLDPRAYDPQSSRALAQLLAAEGVRVQLVTTLADARAAAGDEATLLVARPELVPPNQLTTLRGSARELVLISPGPDVLRSLAPPVSLRGSTEVRDRAPGCEFPLAVAAGDADLGGALYTAAEGAALCYTDGGLASLVRVPAGGDGPAVTVLGAPAPLTNDKLDENGNATLALRLLGQQPVLVWYLPSLSDPALGGGTRSLTSLLPQGLKLAAVQIGVAVALFALWRARRLGRIVAEPLPVVVRAAETVEGRARLYRRSRARDQAADALRTTARTRLVHGLGLPHGAEPQTLVEAVAERAGRPRAEVAAVLYGAPPGDDAALVRLADALDALREEVRGP
jgi:uncharacterized protein DUF4350